jgi:hypothetical protein
VTDLETRDVKAFRHPGSSQRKQAKPRNQREGGVRPSTRHQRTSQEWRTDAWAWASLHRRRLMRKKGKGSDRKQEIVGSFCCFFCSCCVFLGVFFWGGGFHAINPALLPVPSADWRSALVSLDDPHEGQNIGTERQGWARPQQIKIIYPGMAMFPSSTKTTFSRSILQPAENQCLSDGNDLIQLTNNFLLDRITISYPAY